ncbi:MAG TPA: hypothetical protein VF929_06680, partial [Gemmatimonadaceae bacterium]
FIILHEAGNMKGIRIAALGVALIVGSASVAHAQQQQGGPGGRRGNMMLMGIDSTLSAEQKAKIEDITKKYAPEQQAVRELMQSDREGAMKKMGELRAKMQPEVRAVLTPNQQAVFDKNLEEMAKRMTRQAPPPAI